MSEEKINGPSRGRKLCKCGEYVGVRVTTHSCGHSFTKPVKDVAPKVIAVSVKPGLIRTDGEKVGADGLKPGFEYYDKSLVTDLKFSSCILVPAGKCPVELSDFTELGVKTWADKVAKICYGKGEFLSKEAMEYYSRRFYRYGVDSDKEQLIKKAIGL